jgi:uncharacterized membrane protein
LRAAERDKRRGVFWLGLLACACAAAACSGASRTSDAPARAAAQDAAFSCDSVAPVALEQAEAVVAKRCTSCHSPTGAAGPDYDWTNERALVAHRRNVAAQIAQDSMPPVGYPRPTSEERRTLLCWAQAPTLARSD